MSLSAFVLLAFSSLFVIVDPVAAAPAFIAMTAQDSPAARVRMARIACLVMASVLIFFAYAGQWIFRLLGITMPAFQLAASIVLLLVALDMLRAKRSRVQETDEETAAGMEKNDIAVTPLAIPMLSGPGAISTAILLEDSAQGRFLHQAALCGCILAVSGVTYLILRFAAHSARFFGPIAMNVAIRIMGLLLAAVAMQFAVNAIRDLRGLFVGTV